MERSFAARAQIQGTLLGERKKIRPWGYKAGLPGQASEYMIRKSIGTSSPLKAKDSAVLAPSNTLIVRTAGGGGYGDPRKRDHSLAVEDLENHYTMKKTAL